MNDLDPEPAEPRCCETCGAEMDWETCWHCGGAGGFHDCGEDCCPCLEPELDLNETCPECEGEGGYLICSALPHAEVPHERRG